MSNTPPVTSQSPFLGAFARVVGLLSIFLYFTGWIYRWAFFGFFRIQLTTLDLPAQSFFFIPIQVFLGSPQAFIKALFILVLAFIGIFLSLRFLKWRRVSSQLSLPLIRQLVIVAWLLMALYWTARWQGVTDAWQAAVNDTSPLPVITLVQIEKGLGLGYNAKNKTYPSLENARIVGDVGLFTNKLRGREVTLPGAPSKIGDWRLLISSKGWLYLFQALPRDAKPNNRRPFVLAVREGGEQFMILSPSSSDK